MSHDGKIKIYRNPARKAGEAHKPYIPQYQLMGVSPEEHKSTLTPEYNMGKAPVPKPSSVNPRLSRPVLQQPYAEAVSSPIGRGRGFIPNVGNNMEQTWSSVDGEITDDISEIDPNHPMIDNNEFVSEFALGESEMPLNLSPELTESVAKSDQTSYNDKQNALKNEYLNILVHQLDEEEYLLLVEGEPVCSGPADFIQEQTRDVVFGEHELCNGNPISINDIILLKRVKIKVGVFLE